MHPTLNILQTMSMILNKREEAFIYRFNNSTLIKKSYGINSMQHHEDDRHHKINFP